MLHKERLQRPEIKKRPIFLRNHTYIPSLSKIKNISFDYNDIITIISNVVKLNLKKNTNMINYAMR